MIIKLQLTKERKLLLGIGVVLLLFGLMYRLTPIFRSMGEEGSEIDLKKQKIVKYMQRIQGGPVLEQQRRALSRNFESLRQGLLQGQTPALAAVSMQNLLREIAETIDVEIKTTRVLKSSKIEKTEYVSVPIQVTADLTVRQLKRLIFKLESADTFLQVTGMQLRNRGDQLPIQLQATITIEGLMSETEQG